MADLLKPLLGDRQRQRPEHHPLMPTFQKRELPIAAQLDAVARRDQRMRVLNAPKPDDVRRQLCVFSSGDGTFPICYFPGTGMPV
jgi:hypothetical protein